MMASYTSSMVMDPQTATPHLKLFLFDAVTIIALMIWMMRIPVMVNTDSGFIVNT